MDERDIIVRIQALMDQDEAFFREHVDDLIILANGNIDTSDDAEILRRCATYVIRDLSVKSLERFC